MIKNIKYIVTILLISIFMISSVAIYNIAFATEETNLEINTSSEKAENLVSGKVGETRTIRSYSHNGTAINIDDLITDLEDCSTGIELNFLMKHASLFCIRKGMKFSGGSNWTHSNLTNLNSSFYSHANGTLGPTGIFSYALAFSQKKGNESSYGSERAQNAIWIETNKDQNYNGSLNSESSELWKAGKAVEEYQSQVSNSGISPTCDLTGSAGTILVKEDNTYKYKIGPFKMSNYAYAYSEYVKPYSGTGNGVKNDGLIGGITSGKLILENGRNVQINGTSCKIEYLTEEKDLDNSRSGSYYSTPSNYNYPWPNSEFYIIVNKDSCGDATTLNKIQFTYQSTEAGGTGWVVENSDSSKTYGQPMLAVNSANVYVKEADYQSNGLRLTTDISIDKYIYDTFHNMPEVLASTSDNGSKDYSTMGKTGINTSLYTKEGEKRENKLDTDKQNAPVYAEYGDLVIYHIDLYNRQNEKVKVGIRDVLPEGTKNLLSVRNLTTNEQLTLAKKGETISEGQYVQSDIAFTTSWIEVPGGSKTNPGKTRIEVRVLVNSYEREKIIENKVTLTTNNAGRIGESGSANEKVDCRNTIKTIGGRAVVNVNSSDKTYYGHYNNGDAPHSSDWYKINDYNATINKYISEYQEISANENNNKEITLEENILSPRDEYTEEEKKNYPLAVDQGDKVIYKIVVKNEAVRKEAPNGTPDDMKDSAVGKATQVRPSEITDYLDIGLELDTAKVTAKIYNSDGSVNTKYTKDGIVNVTVENSLTATSDKYNAYVLKIGDETILNPGDYIVYEIPVTIKKSNMYLDSLENKAELRVLTNINHHSADVNGRVFNNPERIIKNGDNTINQNISQRQSSSEFVRMKDLVISGYVWLDKNKDGYMPNDPTTNPFESSINVDTNPTNYNSSEEKAMENIVVKLYQIDPTDPNNPKLFRTVKTNSKGIYTFGFAENSNSEFRDGTYSIVRDGSGLKATDSDQRIIKAINKNPITQKYDITLNKNDNYYDNYYYKYYIEFEYDGILYKSTVYSGDSHLNQEDEKAGTMNTEELYKKDSNATEFDSVRNAFDSNHEIVGYNYASDGTNTNKTNLEYQKDGHNSYLKYDKNRIITARSFVTDTTANTDAEKLEKTKLLWLFKYRGKTEEPETNYLKYINLGLEERENVDISVVQDVYEVRNIINGEEMTYKYNQNKYATDLFNPEEIYRKAKSNIDFEEPISETFTQKYYMTGYETDSSTLTPYIFKYYLADYNYKVDQYNIETVRNYKTQDSELNSEISFRIKATNNIYNNDEPSKENHDIKVYTRINEVIEYFDNEFMKIEYNEDGNVKSINVKTKDSDGYLIDTPLQIADVHFVLADGTEIPATISNDSLYNQITNSEIDGSKQLKQIKENVEKAGYQTVYIRPIDETNKAILAEGESVDIIIKFIVAKDDSRNLKLGLKTAISEIGAYSTYYDAEGTRPAGLVDKDSNPGNFGETYNKIEFCSNNEENSDYLALYEDDNYKTGIDLGTQKDNERIIEGQVWDDARSNEALKQDETSTQDGIQYIGDGKNGTVEGVENKKAADKAKTNKAFEDAKNYKNVDQEKNDFLVDDVGVKLVELVRIPQYDASGGLYEERIYEETIKVSDKDSVVQTRTGKEDLEEGKYELKGYIPGEYTVRFSYGDDTSDQMALFNGQDYKSTTYQAGIDTYADEAYLGDSKDSLGNAKKDTDRVLEILETKGLSDAKDDEIRRLETVSYSETLNNNKTLILRGLSSISRDLQKEYESMNAETAEFLVRAEKEKKDKTILTYQETMNKFNAEKNERHPIENIDFGLQYRPEQQVALNKFIKNLTITTSDANTGNVEPLVEAKFNEYYGIVVDTDLETGVTKFLSYNQKYEDNTSEDIIVKVDKDGKNVDDVIAELTKNGYKLNVDKDKIRRNQDGKYQIIVAGTELDKENSVGLANLQFVPNDKDSHASDSNQGFLYLNVDDEIMQGAEIKIQYLFTGHNLSEIDRVSKNLSELRFKNNTHINGTSGENYDPIKIAAMRDGGTLGSVSLITTINNYGDEAIYSGALTARNDLFNEYYRYEVTSSDPNTALAKTDDSEDHNPIIYGIKRKNIGESDYYGKYLGTTYYTGKVSGNEIVAELKIDKILDYVDNNLVFKQEDNDANSVDHFWRTTSASELVLGGYIWPEVLKFDKETENQIKKVLEESDDIVSEAAKIIQRYSNKTKLKEFLASKIDITTAQDYIELIDKGLLLDSEGVAYNTETRSNLALLQDLRTSDSQNENDIVNADITKFLKPRDSEALDSFGKVKIVTSKVISAEDDTKNMVYENVGEIVEYSSVTGRVTNLSTTLGNVDLSHDSNTNNSPEYEQNKKKESDTAAVEKVTLTPPTGLSKTSRIIKKAVKGASYVGITATIVAILIFGTFGGIKLYRKRRIK